MRRWWLGLADPPGPVVKRLRDAPPAWGWTLILLALWLGACTALQWLGLTLYPPSLPPEGVPQLWAYALYSGLLMLVAAAALAWIAGLLAEAFDGRRDTEAALFATALGFLPLGFAKAVRDWPGGTWLAWLLLLWGLLLLYRLLGVSLHIRSGRTAYLFAVLMGTLVVMLAVGWQLRDLIPGAAPAARMGRLWLI